MKKSLANSRNVLEEKRKKYRAKNLHKKEHVYNNCYELRSRAINKFKLIDLNMKTVIPDH